MSFSRSFLYDDFRVTDIFFNGTPYFDTFSYPLYKSIELLASIIKFEEQFAESFFEIMRTHGDTESRDEALCK